MFVPKSHRGEAVLTTAYLINCTSSSCVIDNVSPLQFLPNNSILFLFCKILSFMCLVVHQQHQTKLDSCVVRCVFVGYLPNKEGTNVYHPPSCEYCLKGCHFS